MMSGFCASVAGILFSSRLQTVDAPLAVGFELTAIAFAVVGGVSLTGGRGSPYRAFPRSEERRVGKECRSRWSPYH